jgi:nitroimidazol reductase NimA-like FMN-containing flavoprotein (pyridoxamine 5'-phosphate oxidase superfamily)
VSAAPRPGAQRRRDTEHRLTHDVDLWVATASAGTGPYLVPLSFDWDGETLLLATAARSPTGRTWRPAGPSGSGWATRAT